MVKTPSIGVKSRAFCKVSRADAGLGADRVNVGQSPHSDSVPPKKEAAGFPPPPHSIRPKALLALRLAFLVGRRQCGRPDVDIALLRGRSVCNVGRPAFFFNDTATTEIYTLSLHDALPISRVLHRVSKIRLFGRHEVSQVRL